MMRSKKFIISSVAIASITTIIALLLFSAGDDGSERWIFHFLNSRRPIYHGPFVQMIGDDQAIISWTSKSEMGTKALLIDNKQVGKENFERKKIFGRSWQHQAKFHVLNGQKHIKYSIQIDKWHREEHELSLDFSELRMIAIGDNQMGYASFQKLLSISADLNPNLFLHVGDMVQNGHKEYDWRKYFFTPLYNTHMLSKVPFIFTQGNHDIVGSDASLYSPYFADFDRFYPMKLGYYYAQTIGPVRMIVIDTNVEAKEQIKWLKEELQSEQRKSAKFTIVSTHIPPFIEFWDPKAWKRREFRWPFFVCKRLLPLFERFKVDLVISGHQHNYQRGSRNGVHFVVSGGAGGDIDKERVEDYKLYDKTILEHHFVSVTSKNNSLEIEMVQINGKIGDKFSIKQRNPSN